MLSREQMLKKLHLVDEHYRRRGRQSFAEFLRYTKPDYQLSWFHEELACVLDAFLDDVLAKRSPRLIVNVPPQEGKSEQVSRRFPAYGLGRDPNLRVVACSYSATLALQFSRVVPRGSHDDWLDAWTQAGSAERVRRVGLFGVHCREYFPTGEVSIPLWPHNSAGLRPWWDP